MGAVLLYDASGNPLPISAGAAVGSTSGLAVAGSDGTDGRIVSIDSVGRVQAQGCGVTGGAAPAGSWLAGGPDGSGVMRGFAAGGGRTLLEVDLGTGVSRGAHAGVSGRRQSRNGYASASRTIIYLGAGILTPPLEPTPGQMNLISNNANDTAAGLGLRTIEVTYYRASSGAPVGPFTEIVTMNGTTQVLMAETSLAYFDRFRGVTFGGSNGSGLISIRTGTTVIYSSFSSELTQGPLTHYVPSGVTCYITDIQVMTSAYGGVAAQNGIFFFSSRSCLGTLANNAEVNFLKVYARLTGGPVNLMFPSPIPVPGPCRIAVRWASDGTNSNTQVDADYGFVQGLT